MQPKLYIAFILVVHHPVFRLKTLLAIIYLDVRQYLQIEVEFVLIFMVFGANFVAENFELETQTIVRRKNSISMAIL